MAALVVGFWVIGALIALVVSDIIKWEKKYDYRKTWRHDI